MTEVVVGMFIGGGLALLAARWWGSRTTADEHPVASLPPIEAMLDLVRRAHGACTACLVRADGAILNVGTSRTSLGDRGVSAARLALADRREVDLDGNDPVFATGNEHWGAAVGFDRGVTREVGAAAIADLRWMMQMVLPHAGSTPFRASERFGFRQSMDTLSALASGVCERARELTGHHTALAMRDEQTGQVQVVAVSLGADRLLLGITSKPESAVARAAAGDAPVVATGASELFGYPLPGRRRADEHGTAYPLRDGTRGVGVLVVLGPRDSVADDVWEQVMWLAANSGAQLAAAAAVKRADERATVDVLTGLSNRAALSQAMGMVEASCAIICVDVDHFKKLNDTLGHPAGDAALKHLAATFRATLREGDLPTRIGGEEFALWLPDTDQQTAIEVAERVRHSVASSRFEWGGQPVPLTCSIGVAAYPEAAGSVDNLLAAADAALYRAKKGGRNRVESALAAVGERSSNL